MKNGWKRVAIKTVYSGLFDGPHATPKPADDGPVFLGIKNISEDGHLVLNEIRHIAEEDFPKWTRRVYPQHNDLVFTYEATLNLYALIPQGLKCCLGRRLALIRPDQSKVNPQFLYFYFFSDDWRKTIATKTVIGSTVDRVPLLEFPDFPISVPSLQTQRKIAGILSAYGELIENNTRRIAILEEMAQAIYREWFVHLRFPGHEDVKLVDSPMGKVPEGWKVVRLESLQADQQYAMNGGPFGSKLGTKDYVDSGVPVIRGTNLSETGRFRPDDFVFVTEQKADELRANLARPGDIVVTQRGTLGQLGMIPQDIGYSRFVISQSQMKVTLDGGKAAREYVFYFLKSPDANTRIKNLASSSGVPHINLGTLREFEILLPPLPLQRRFTDIASAAESGIELQLKRIRNLRTTRDLLLPKLISGQLDVEDLDIETGETATAE